MQSKLIGACAKQPESTVYLCCLTHAYLLELGLGAARVSGRLWHLISQYTFEMLLEQWVIISMQAQLWYICHIPGARIGVQCVSLLASFPALHTVQQ